MDLFLLLKFSIPVRSKSSEIRGKEKRGYIDFFYEKVYFNRVFMLEDISEGKLPCQVFRDLIKVDPTIGNVRLWGGPVLSIFLFWSRQ